MAKAKGLKALTAVTSAASQMKAATTRHTPIEQKTQTNRGVKAGAGVRRGDRRDTHPSYSTGKVSRDGGRAGRLGKSTRKGGPKTGDVS